MSDKEDTTSSDEEIVSNKEENEQELEVEKNEENEIDIEELLNENQIAEEPKVGMMFNLEEDVRAYYTRYAKQKGFGVSRRTSKLGDDGKSVKYFTLSCVCQGNAKSRAANPLKPQSKQNLGCKTKINASRCLDGRFMVSTRDGNFAPIRPDPPRPVRVFLAPKR